ncbi:peptidyl-prolyl cis-trans isomerase FKBP3-like [Stigmatopora argus]
MFKKISFNCVFQILNEHRLLGNIKNVAKTTEKGPTCRRHVELFVSKMFKATETVEEVKAVQIDKTKEVKAEVLDEGPFKFTKSTLKKG